MPPGPGLAAVLATIDLSRLGGLDCVEVLRAQHRQASHEQARQMAAMVEVALCAVGPDAALPRMAVPDEWSADEIRAALSWTRSAADTQLSLAWDLTSRLPQVFAALDAGHIDMPRTRVFSEWTGGLTDQQAHQICDRLLPEAPRLTTGQLCERIKKMAIAIDPEWARKRYEEAVRDRKVVGYRNEDGTGTLSGYNLPADQAAAACAHIDAVARTIKRSGDGRPIDHIRADLYIGLLDGSYIGWSERDIVAHMLTAANERTDTDRQAKPTDPRGSQSHVGSSQTKRNHDEHRRAPAHSSTQLTPTPAADDTRAGTAPTPPSGRRAGVEVRTEITTLLGLNDHPAEIAGWGFVDAETARRLVADQTAAEWRFAITNDDGHLLFEGITRVRPAGFPARADAPCRGGVVELQITLADLGCLAARPARLPNWAKLIADLANQAGHQPNHQQGQYDRRHGHGAGDESGSCGDGDWSERRRDHDRDERRRDGRSPGVPLRRRTQIRDRTCTYPGCRVPANCTDGDHTREWGHGGPTTDDNIGSACRHDHRLRHEGGWRVSQPTPGQFTWTSRLGMHYRVRPPLIIEPLPDPIPRHPPTLHRRPPPHGLDDDSDDDEPTWREPQAVPTPGPTGDRGAPDEPPPF